MFSSKSFTVAVVSSCAILTSGCAPSDTSSRGSENNEPTGITAGVSRTHGARALERLRLADSVSQSPRFVALRARQNRIMLRGQLALAVIEGPLPPGVEAVIRLGQSDQLHRYIVVSSQSLNDDLLARARVKALSYEVTHEEDTTAVTITMQGGMSEFRSRKLGTWIAATERPDATISPRNDVTLYVRESLPGAATLHVSGFGLARVVRW